MEISVPTVDGLEIRKSPDKLMMSLLEDLFDIFERKCSFCDEKATWISGIDDPCFCDDHFCCRSMFKGDAEMEMKK
jgi:hypothetical protein